MTPDAEMIRCRTSSRLLLRFTYVPAAASEASSTTAATGIHQTFLAAAVGVPGDGPPSGGASATGVTTWLPTYDGSGAPVSFTDQRNPSATAFRIASRLTGFTT